LHLVRHRTALKNRVDSTLITHGVANPTSDLFGARGRELLARLSLPEPWHSTTRASLTVIDLLDTEISAIERELRALGLEHRYIPLLITCPGIAWVLAFTIASELGDISRFSTPTKFVGYTGLCPKVDQSGERDRRGPLRKNGPNYLRWALVEAAHTALRHPCYQPTLARQTARHGRKRGRKIAAIEVGRKLAEAIWYMLSRNQPFAPAGAKQVLTA
jgi:transposase